MNNRTKPTKIRSLMLAALLGIATFGAATRASAAGPSAQFVQGNQLRTSLHQEITLSASPAQVFDALLDSKKFAAFTGMKATIHRQEGGAFSTFDGIVTGRTIELVKNERIVQAWRPSSWPKGVYSIVKFELKPHGSGTTLILDHTGFPEGKFDGLDSGWGERYWTPLKKYLGS